MTTTQLKPTIPRHHAHAAFPRNTELDSRIPLENLAGRRVFFCEVELMKIDDDYALSYVSGLAETMSKKNRDCRRSG